MASEHLTPKQRERIENLLRFDVLADDEKTVYALFERIVAEAVAAERERMAEVERDRDALLWLAQEAIQAHREQHRIYGSTATCSGGIGGAAMTQHCSVICGYDEKHDAENERWYNVEAAYFRRQDGDPEWAARIARKARQDGGDR